MAVLIIMAVIQNPGYRATNMTFEEALKLQSMDELHSNMANNSCVDMYKFSMYAAEIERRENLQSVAGASGSAPGS